MAFQGFGKNRRLGNIIQVGIQGMNGEGNLE